MMRICKTSSGDVFVDDGGRASGRGAYVCSQGCAHDAIIAGKLSSALRTRVDRDRSETLLRDLGVETGAMASVRDKE